MITVTKAIGDNKILYPPAKSLADVTGFIEERMNGQSCRKSLTYERKSEEEEFDNCLNLCFESTANTNKYANIMEFDCSNIKQLICNAAWY